jgi:hypothetical protein
MSGIYPTYDFELASGPPAVARRGETPLRPPRSLLGPPQSDWDAAAHVFWVSRVVIVQRQRLLATRATPEPPKMQPNVLSITGMAD